MASLSAQFVIPLIAKAALATGVRSIGGIYRVLDVNKKEEPKLRHVTMEREKDSAEFMFGASALTYGATELAKAKGLIHIKNPYAEMAFDLVPLGIASVIGEALTRHMTGYNKALNQALHPKAANDNLLSAGNDNHKTHHHSVKSKLAFSAAPESHPFNRQINFAEGFK